MNKRTWIALLCLLTITTCAPGLAEAYVLDYFMVQHRTYENGSKHNRIAFAVKDANGGYVTQDKLESLALYGPDGKQLKLTDKAFYSYKELDGVYDGPTGRWQYMTTFYTSGNYRAFISASELAVGTYKLAIVYDGAKLEGNWYFYGQVNLPVIKSTTFKYWMDKYGNFMAEWGVPYDLCRTSPNLETSVRVWIDSYKGKTWIGEAFVRVPTHMGRLFLPSSIVSQLKKQGDNFTMGVHLRTNDNCNRTYSTPKKVVFKKPSAMAEDMEIELQDMEYEADETGSGT